MALIAGVARLFLVDPGQLRPFSPHTSQNFASANSPTHRINDP